MTLIDLSHPLFDGMPGYRFTLPNGKIEEFTIKVEAILKREDTAKLYNNQASFLLSKMRMHTAVGTYLDVPFHRFADGKDISQFDLSDFILEGIIVDASSDNKNNAILSAIESSSMKGKALLIYFGKGSEWGTEAYYTYPALTQDEIDQIAASKVKLVGVDTINIDDSSRYHRPAHTKFLSNNILIVENLTNLDKILNKKFRLFAVPLNIPKVPNMPVRVFAEVY